MKKKRLKKILIGIAIALGVFLIAFIAFFIWVIMTAPKDNITDQTWSYNLEITLPDNKEDWPELMREEYEKYRREWDFFYQDLEWYDTVEEAIENGDKFEDTLYKDYVLSQEFYRLEFDDRLVIFFKMPNGANEKEELMAFMLFAVNQGQVSQPYDYQVYRPEPSMGSKAYAFDCDDAIVDYMIFELRINDALDEYGMKLFFGTWPDREELESLTIDGVPLEILEEPITINHKEYYFWYITDLSWSEKLLEIYWSSFTYGDVIEILDIQYTPTVIEEKK